MTTRFNLSTDRAFAIADAQHVLASSEQYWPALERFGVTASEKKSFQDRLARAIVLHDGEAAPAENALAELRPELFDLLGALRASAELVAFNARAEDQVAAQQLKVGGTFPASDMAVARYWKDLPKAIKKYSGQLSARGFSKEEQARLLERMAAFERLVKERGDGKSTRKKSGTERDTAFADLRWTTQYFRRAGRAALRTSPERVHFDRVTNPPRRGKKPEVVTGAGAVVEGPAVQGALQQPPAAGANGKAKGALERMAQ